MSRGARYLLAALLSLAPARARTVVFWQPDFPTVASQPMAQATLQKALAGLEPAFADLEALRAQAEAGATVLVTGPFDQDPHFHPTGLQSLLGLQYATTFPMQRSQTLRLPSGPVPVTFSGDRALFLDQAVLPGGATWLEQPLGKGRVHFQDVRSGRTVDGGLEPGRAALILIGTDGAIKASYNWKGLGPIAGPARPGDSAFVRFPPGSRPPVPWARSQKPEADRTPSGTSR